MFWEDPAEVVRAAAPMWHFGRPGGSKSCYPSVAVKPGGKKPNGNISDLGRLGSLKEGCAEQGDWHGPNTPGAYMPTYYSINFCKGDSSWRITYYLYFSHDSGHRYDWEWASVVWKKDQDGEDNWYRSAIKTSFHKTSKMTDWGAIQNTINGWDDRFDQNGKDRDHAKVYVGSFRHAMFLDRYTGLATLGADELEFRSNDWFFLPNFDNELIDGLTLPDFKYGDAASTPRHMHDEDRICMDP
ncbi:MAG: hypothetical protein HETSPECPRED_006797 [Heterodermia speciosa]|uniref:Uncharacterized protein n=1 Tax=Heterodermia speciosa TaxID=116794 RepID=A0A8H3IHK4_9LECA|nr:MAG: hypothetical protein HETSPECPRED_006797 [Heterodermia speciosa]